MKQIEDLTEEEGRAAEVFRALGNPARLRIVRELARRNACVTGDLVELLPLAQSTVSQHLKVLKEAGLVADEARGTARIYRIHADGLSELRDWLDSFWDDALSNFKAHAERGAEGDKQ